MMMADFRHHCKALLQRKAAWINCKTSSPQRAIPALVVANAQ
jgi:hypothetical protein